jgi:hypothetical protein
MFDHTTILVASVFLNTTKIKKMLGENDSRKKSYYFLIFGQKLL